MDPTTWYGPVGSAPPSRRVTRSPLPSIHCVTAGREAGTWASRCPKAGHSVVPATRAPVARRLPLRITADRVGEATHEHTGCVVGRCPRRVVPRCEPDFVGPGGGDGKGGTGRGCQDSGGCPSDES